MIGLFYERVLCSPQSDVFSVVMSNGGQGSVAVPSRRVSEAASRQE